MTFKAVLPKKFNAFAIIQELARENKRIAKDVLSDFEKTTATWSEKNKPRFRKEIIYNPNAIGFRVFTVHRIYTYVTRGTKPHRIKPRRRNKSGMLSFRWAGPGSYRAKTTPGVIGSQGGGASGPVVKSKGVNHPGTAPRDFDIVLAKQWQPTYQQRMQAALNKGLKRSGYG